MVSAAVFPVSRAASVTRDFRSCRPHDKPHPPVMPRVQDAIPSLDCRGAHPQPREAVPLALDLGVVLQEFGHFHLVLDAPRLGRVAGCPGRSTNAGGYQEPDPKASGSCLDPSAFRIVGGIMRKW
jgi:hypothetical protein